MSVLLGYGTAVSLIESTITWPPGTRLMTRDRPRPTSSPTYVICRDVSNRPMIMPSVERSISDRLLLSTATSRLAFQDHLAVYRSRLFLCESKQ